MAITGPSVIFFNGNDFAEQAKKADEVGFHGLTVWGEPSPYYVNDRVELSRVRPVHLGPR